MATKKAAGGKPRRKTATRDARKGKRSAQHFDMTSSQQANALRLIRAGMHVEQAFVAAGVHRATYYRIKAKARAGEAVASELFAKVDRAIAECEADDVVTTHSASRLEQGRVKCRCGRLVDVDLAQAEALVGRLSDAQRAKAAAAGVAIDRLQRRFPKRWSPRVLHEVAEEHGRLLDVAERVLEPEVFELLLAAYVEGDGGGEASPAPESTGATFH